MQCNYSKTNSCNETCILYKCDLIVLIFSFVPCTSKFIDEIRTLISFAISVVIHHRIFATTFNLVQYFIHVLPVFLFLFQITYFYEYLIYEVIANRSRHLAPGCSVWCVFFVARRVSNFARNSRVLRVLMCSKKKYFVQNQIFHQISRIKKCSRKKNF